MFKAFTLTLAASNKTLKDLMLQTTVVSHFCLFPVTDVLCVIDRDSSEYSAVCAYKIEDIKTVFSKSKFKTPVTVETSFVKWVMYSGELPDPRPGAVSLLFNNSVRHSFNNTDFQS